MTLTLMTSLYLAFHHARWCHVGGLVVRDWRARGHAGAAWHRSVMSVTSWVTLIWPGSATAPSWAYEVSRRQRESAHLPDLPVKTRSWGVFNILQHYCFFLFACPKIQIYSDDWHSCQCFGPKLLLPVKCLGCSLGGCVTVSIYEYSHHINTVITKPPPSHTPTQELRKHSDHWVAWFIAP